MPSRNCKWVSMAETKKKKEREAQGEDEEKREAG